MMIMRFVLCVGGLVDDDDDDPSIPSFVWPRGKRVGDRLNNPPRAVGDRHVRPRGVVNAVPHRRGPPPPELEDRRLRPRGVVKRRTPTA